MTRIGTQHLCFWIFPTTIPTTHKMSRNYDLLIPSDPFQHLTFGQVSSIIRRQQNNTASDKDLSFRQTFPPCLRLTNKLKNRQYFYFLKFIMESLRLFTQKEVCSLFQISKTKLYRDIAAGLFPRPITIGKTSVRWRGIDLETVIKGGK